MLSKTYVCSLYILINVICTESYGINLNLLKISFFNLTAQKILGKVEKKNHSHLQHHFKSKCFPGVMLFVVSIKYLGLLCLFMHSLKIYLCATWKKMTSVVLLRRKYLNNTFKLFFYMTCISK